MTVKKKMAGADQIIIDRMEALCRLGVTEQERSRPQTILLSLSLQADLGRAGKSDRLQDTVDYATVIEGIRNLLASRPFVLIEAVADRTAEWNLSRYPSINQVIVQAMKNPFPGAAGG